ncbi:MAG: ester cyclase [Deltaproteobacteria bacterium]|nr:ester cyclase [Deltaproteobacteria bacterium]
MRKVLVFGFIGLVMMACGGEPPVAVAPQPTVTAPPPPPPVDTTPPAPTAPPAPPPKKPLADLQKEAGKALAEGFAAGDAKKVAALYTENATFKLAGQPDLVGRANIEKALTNFFGAFGKVKMGEQRVFVKKEIVVTEWVMNATHSGDFMGTKATEKPVGWVGASVLWFDDDGKIKEDHTYWNVAVVPFQIGTSKDKNRTPPALPGAPQVMPSTGAPAEEENVKVVHSLNEALEKKDEKKLGALFADKAEWDDITLPEAQKGKAAILKYWKGLSTAFPDGKASTTLAFGAGDWVVEEGTYAGTNNGPLFGAPPTKKAMTIHELNIVQLDKDKKIVKAVTYGNDLEMTAQLAPPKKDAAPAKPATPAPAKPTTPATATPAKK